MLVQAVALQIGKLFDVVNKLRVQEVDGRADAAVVIMSRTSWAVS